VQIHRWLSEVQVSADKDSVVPVGNWSILSACFSIEVNTLAGSKK